MNGLRAGAIGAAVIWLAGLLTPAWAAASPGATPLVTQSITFRTADGTELHATVAGFGTLAPRPVIVEDSPYSPGVGTLSWVGLRYNFVELQWRGTGASGGSLDTTGPADQADLSQFLGWACHQPWSNRRIGLYGFSASAIVVYNAMHLQLPCVKAAAMMAGTTDLYRDLMYVGGIFNVAAGAFVEASIAAPTLGEGPTRLQTDPASVLATLLGYPEASLAFTANQTEDGFWGQRTFKGDADRIPILADTSFYDVEPDGPFAVFNATLRYGSHLLVDGAHDGFPAGTPGPFPQYENWFDHYLLGAPLSAANQPVVSVYAGDGSRQQFLDDQVTHLTGPSWPLPGTAWTSLYMSPGAGLSGLSGGGLRAQPPVQAATQAYPFLPSELTETDLHNTSVLDTELDSADAVLPWVNDMQLSGLASLTYTSPALARSFTSIGPGAVDLYASSLEPYTDLYVVLADVWPDGTAYPVATGALRTSFPDIDRSRSLIDRSGNVVDPYTDFASTSPALPGQTREYQVPLLPFGNQFAAGSRIAVYVLGTPLDQLGAPPGVDTVTVGGATPSRLLLPGVGGGPVFAG